MNKILKQFMKFLLVSGTGWMIDIGVYSIFTLLFNRNLFFSNIISSILAISFVFHISTKKIFDPNKKNLSLKIKYIVYFIYQLVLIILVSIIIQKLYLVIENYYQLEISYLKIILKIIITPFTMMINFGFIKVLSEKL